MGAVVKRLRPNEGILVLVCAGVLCLLAAACDDEESSPPAQVVPEPAAPPKVDPEPVAAPDEPASADPSARAEPASPEEPQGVAAVADLPEGRVRAELSEEAGAHLRSQLRRRHRARVQLRELIHVTEEGAAGVIYAFYEMSVFEQCTTRRIDDGQARREAHRACREELVNTTDDAFEKEQLAACTRSGVVHAAVHPAHGQRGERVVIVRDQPIEHDCTLGGVQTFSLRDLDADGRLELEIHYSSHTPEIDARSGGGYDHMQVAWVALDAETLGPQLRVELASGIFNDSGDDEGGTARRVSLEDDDGDGHPDVIEESITYSHGIDCRLGLDTGWPSEHASDHESCELSEIVRRVLRWDQATDTWLPV